MATTLTLPEKIVEQIGYSSAALEKAAAVQIAQAAITTKVAALIPQVVDALVAGERIRENQRDKAAEALKDPVQALELLIKVAVHRNTGEQSLGSATNSTTNGSTKTAAARDPRSSLTNPNVGRRTTMVKQSDVNLFTKLGLQVPSE